MRIKASAIMAVALLALATQSVRAGNVVGYNAITVPTNADVVVANSFNQPVEGSFAVGSVDADGLNVSGGGLVDGEWDDGTYYLIMTSGTAAGKSSTISSNDTGKIFMSDLSFIGEIGATDTFDVYPHNTLARVFPDGLEGLSFEASIKNPFLPFISTFKTQILVFDGGSAGQNKLPTSTYFYFDGAWRKVGQSLTANFDDAILAVGGSFVIRNQNSTNQLTYVPNGKVPFEVRTIELTNGVADDVYASSSRPVNVRLRDLGLGGTAAFVDSVKNPFLPFIQTFGDQLLVYDTTAGVQNPLPSATYFYFDGAWRKVGQSLTSKFDNDVLLAGNGFVIRKGSALGSGTADWVNRAPF